MVEILPIKLLDDTDAPIFGNLNVALGKLAQSGLPVASGIVITSPNLKLKTTLEHYDFGSKEIFEQSLALVRKEINSSPIPDILIKEVVKHSHCLVGGQQVKSVKELWITLLNIWLEEIKFRLWRDGFTRGVTDGLEPQVVIFTNKIKATGVTYEDQITEEVVIKTNSGHVEAAILEKIKEVVRKATKKLFIPHTFEWLMDDEVKLCKVMPYIDTHNQQVIQTSTPGVSVQFHTRSVHSKSSAVKVFLDLSAGLVVKRDVDGVFIASEKIFDLNKPRDSFEDLLFRLVECATTFDPSPILFKLADKSEGMGQVRGTLRLLHQQSLFEPMVEALDFVRFKKGLTNVDLVIPFVRTTTELSQIKKELAVKRLTRRSSLKQWMEVAVPENIINLENYLTLGIDGVVLNLDELIAYINGFDYTEEELFFYKNEVVGLIKFLEDGLKLLHKTRVPFIATGSLSLNPKILDFLIEKGVYGIVVERYEAHSANELLYLAEKRFILRKNGN